MNTSQSKIDSELHQLADLLEDTLGLLASVETDTNMFVSKEVIQPSLFEQCIELCRNIAGYQAEPVRTIHHLSCTGGTLIIKCLAAMPNVIVLNEVDPLSTIGFNHKKPDFTPTDLLALIKQGDQKIPRDLLIKLFIDGIKTLHSELTQIGKRLLIRDHSHSHFLVGDTVEDRPTVLSLLSDSFTTISAITVRDPVDSYLSLTHNIQHGSWGKLTTYTFDEYCNRYNMFLDAHIGISTIMYEKFVEDPAMVLKELCTMLNLEYSASFIDTFDTFKFSGDSGRGGRIISARPRRVVSEAFAQSAYDSIAYRKLSTRLGYDLVSI